MAALMRVEGTVAFEGFGEKGRIIVSMLAKFARIPSDRLRQIIADPDLATEVFDGSEATPSGMPAMPADPLKRGPMNTELIRRASEVLASSLGTMDPAMRERVKKSFGAVGIDPEALASGKAGEKLIEMMRQRAQAMGAGLQASRGGGPAGGAAPARPVAVISLDKAWHGIHYLMCGAAEPGSTLLSQVVMGGTEVGEDLGYGPARYFEADAVPDIVRELTRAGLEAEMQARFAPSQMTTAGIYPNGWRASDLAWVMDEFRKLRQFFVDAGTAKEAVLTALE